VVNHVSETYGGKNYDGGKIVQQTLDNGYIIFGETGSYGNGGKDIWLIKIDENGIKQWEKTFGGSSRDRICAGQQTLDGGYIILGDTWGYKSGVGGILLIKTDENGHQSWFKVFPQSAMNQAIFIQQTSDEGYIIVAKVLSHKSTSRTSYDVCIIKTDKYGNMIWVSSSGFTSDTDIGLHLVILLFNGPDIYRQGMNPRGILSIMLYDSEYNYLSGVSDIPLPEIYDYTEFESEF